MTLRTYTLVALTLIGPAGNSYGQNIETINCATGTVYVGEFSESGHNSIVRKPVF